MSNLAFPASTQSNAAAREGQFVRRRGTLEQGRALEALGHAVEYLVDSQWFRVGDSGLRDDHEAVQILMRMSRAVFAECPEAVSLRRRVGRWFVSRFAGDPEIPERG